MIQINPYLSFNGNCREAMTFYQECLGGELVFQTIGESPLSEKMPEKMKNCILYAKLTKNKLVLIGTDMLGEKGLTKGNNISINLTFTTEKEIRNCYSKLSNGSSNKLPFENGMNYTLFLELTDKYGNDWILNFHKPKIK